MIRIAVALFALVAVCLPGFSARADSLSERERNDMLAECRQVPASYRSICEDAIKSGKVSVNILRWCAHSIQHEVKKFREANGSVSLDKVKQFAGATICRGGLKAAGYRIP